VAFGTPLQPGRAAGLTERGFGVTARAEHSGKAVGHGASRLARGAWRRRSAARRLRNVRSFGAQRAGLSRPARYEGGALPSGRLGQRAGFALPGRYRGAGQPGRGGAQPSGRHELRAGEPARRFRARGRATPRRGRTRPAGRQDQSPRQLFLPCDRRRQPPQPARLRPAIDVAGFRLSDGTTVSVEHDWSESGPKRQFLRHLARRACSYFSVVLTPDSNAEHHDHIHLDIGPDRLCSV
jgi:hypothetical protein